jgi:hypothetical protein
VRVLTKFAIITALLAGFALLPAAAQTIAPNGSPEMRPPSERPEPTDALGWFRRADNITNIRMPGSAPFHMTVKFHGYPGIDFVPKGKSTVQTGDGVYEETWQSPEAWRREVTFGAYHAVEVRAGGVRKFQASSDYEPSRVLMLLRALLTPIPRITLEPELDDLHLKWKVEHRAAGNLSYVRIAFTQDALGGSGLHPFSASFEFLPSGVLVRAVDIHGIGTSWQDDRVFASRLVPRQLAVQAMSNNLVTASVDIQTVPSGAPAIAQIDGLAAEPGATLRPFEDLWDHREVRTFPEQPAINFEYPRGYAGDDPKAFIPEGGYVGVSFVIDRNGLPHEAEWTDIANVTGSQAPADLQPYIRGASSMVQAVMKSQFRPPTVDREPCEVLSMAGLVSGGVHWITGGH